MMKFLVDNALSPFVARELKNAGYDAIHVRDLDMQSAEDEAIFLKAKAENRTIISTDTDFANLPALWNEIKPSVILFRRETDRHPDLQVKLLLANLANLKNDLLNGCIVVFHQDRIRIRNLPINPLE